MSRKKSVRTPHPPHRSDIGSVTQVKAELYQGPIPHPDVLQRLDDMVPGTAQRLIDLAVDESQHRRSLETNALSANIMAQEKSQALASLQCRSGIKTERLGMLFGAILSIACVTGATIIAGDNKWLAALLVSLPVASIIRAFLKR